MSVSETPTNHDDAGLLILRGEEVAALLEGKDAEVIRIVAEAYKEHVLGNSSLPHSSFVYLPGEGSRIIALPAFLGGNIQAAGVKWIASVPANIERGMDRASAVIVLNDTNTGYPRTLLEGSLISARRTAASAVLTTGLLSPMPRRMALIGCGMINFEIARMASRAFRSFEGIALFDVLRDRAESCGERLSAVDGVPPAEVAATFEEACSSCDLISIATTASHPHILEKNVFQAGAVILHVSLRDLNPHLILRFDNVVDDKDHVCRANTSLHLAEQLTGNRDFIRCSVGDILLGRSVARKDLETPVIFSPFGLGVLDLALSNLVQHEATRCGMGTNIPSFRNSPWRT